MPERQCWTVINHIRTNPTEDDSPCNDYNEDQEEETLSQETINASTTSSSIVRESNMVPIIPEACLVEIDEGENRVAGVAEPMPLLWEQVRAKIICSSSFLICTLFVLVFLGAAFLIVIVYPYLFTLMMDGLNNSSKEAVVWMGLLWLG